MDKVRYLIGIVFCLLMMGVGTVFTFMTTPETE